MADGGRRTGREAPDPDAPPARFVPPADYAISVRAKRGIDVTAADQGSRVQPMCGFEDTYVDIVDYIIRITDRIWVAQDVGYIYETYTEDCRVYDDSGPRYGVDGVVESTVQAIHAFPDTRHHADDVIWAGNQDQGFATSHRAVNVGHHLGPWRWGPRTGRRVSLWVIANCVSRANRIREEWVLYNLGARLEQCGIDIEAAARAYGNEGLSIPLRARELPPMRALGTEVTTGRLIPSGGVPRFEVDSTVRALFHEVYNRRNLSAIDRVYSQNVRWHGATNREGYGRDDVRDMARALLATFPDLHLGVDEVYWMGNDEDGFAVSVRWTALGTHLGAALYDRPTGRRVHLWGISQLYFDRGRIFEEWALFNEFDVLAQLRCEDPLDG